MSRDIKNTFDILSINYCLEQVYVQQYNPDEDNNYEDTLEEVIKNIDTSGYCSISKCYTAFDYDYESEVWFLKGLERKKCLKYMIEYIEKEFIEDFERDDYRSFWKIMNVYAILYIKNNCSNWFDNIDLDF